MQTWPRHDLTELEIRTLVMLSNGYKQEEMARLQGVKTETIKSRLGYIYRKLEVDSAVGAVARALREGIIE